MEFEIGKPAAPEITVSMYPVRNWRCKVRTLPHAAVSSHENIARVEKGQRADINVDRRICQMLESDTAPSIRGPKE
jgi:hypothetical protein